MKVTIDRLSAIYEVPNSNIPNGTVVLETELVGENLTKYFSDSTPYAVTLKDSDGNYLRNQNVTINLNGKPYIRTTDENGMAKMNINLNAGEYNVISSFSGTDDYPPSNTTNLITILPTVYGSDITKMFKNQAIKFDYCSLNNYYMTRLLNRQNKPFLIKINDISEVNEDISKMNIFLKENDNIEEIRDEINSKFEVNAFIMQDSTSSEKWLVINPKGLNKCTTLELLCKEHGLTLDNAIFFGDGLNDVELIQNAGLGVAMGNALPVVKSVSKDITLTNDEDGVAKYITNVLEYSAEGGFYDIL